MPKADKDITGKVVDFLRKNGGEAVIHSSRVKAKELFGCWDSSLTFALNKLLGADVIEYVGKKNGIFNVYKLGPEFLEGDSWREVLKRKSSGGKAEAGPDIVVGSPEKSIPVGEHTDEGCLKYRVALSRELVEVYGRLEEAQSQITLLKSEIDRLQDRVEVKERKIEELAGELEAETGARKREANDLAVLELQLRELRSKTSNSSSKRIGLDSNGVIIARGEGLPDRA